MKGLLVAIFALVSCAHASDSDLQCSYPRPNVPTKWIDMRSKCVTAMIGQIQNEMAASMQFLAMSAYFKKDDVNRRGYSDFFYSYSCEERDHGIALAEYLVQRGQFKDGVDQVFKNSYPPSKTSWESVIEALDDSIVLEGKMTESIRNVIKICEKADNFEDYALDDWLTAQFLKEQYHDQFELAKAISSIEKMMKKHEGLGEFLADIDIRSCERLCDDEL